MCFSIGPTVLSSDCFLFVFNQDEANEQMHVEEADGGSTSSSEDEVISMCRKNLKMATDFVVQLVSILGMYSDNIFVKLPPRSLFARESGLEWVQRT